MYTKTVSCEVACRMCGWNTAGTIPEQRPASIKSIMEFVERHWPEHQCIGTSGELLISWHPSDAEAE